MLIYKIACEFEKLVNKNNNFVKNQLFSIASLYESIDLDDQLKPALEDYLKIKISKDIWSQWLLNHEEKIKDLLPANWGRISHGNQDGIYYNQYGDAEEWILTKNLHELRSSYENDGLDFDIKEASLLQGINIIPNLYLIRANIEGEFQLDQPEQESPEIAHNSFIVTALNKFFGPIPSHDALEFIENNKTKINNLRQSFQQNPSYLGGGEDGVAFSIGPSLVLKIFQETFTYEKVMEAWNRLHTMPKSARTEAMIYDVGTLGNYLSYPIYYYIIEKMQPIRSENTTDSGAYIERNIESIIDLALQFIKNNRNNLFKQIKDNFAKNPNSAKLNAEIKSIAIAMSKDVSSILNKQYENIILDTKREIENNFNIKLRQNWLSIFVEELIMKYLTSRTDLHTGNLGVTSGGYLRYYDPAYPKALSL